MRPPSDAAQRRRPATPPTPRLDSKPTGDAQGHCFTSPITPTANRGRPYGKTWSCGVLERFLLHLPCFTSPSHPIRSHPISKSIMSKVPSGDRNLSDAAAKVAEALGTRHPDVHGRSRSLNPGWPRLVAHALRRSHARLCLSCVELRPVVSRRSRARTLLCMWVCFAPCVSVFSVASCTHVLACCSLAARLQFACSLLACCAIETLGSSALTMKQTFLMWLL